MSFELDFHDRGMSANRIATPNGAMDMILTTCLCKYPMCIFHVNRLCTTGSLPSFFLNRQRNTKSATHITVFSMASVAKKQCSRCNTLKAEGSSCSAVQRILVVTDWPGPVVHKSPKAGTWRLAPSCLWQFKYLSVRHLAVTLSDLTRAHNIR